MNFNSPLLRITYKVITRNSELIENGSEVKKVVTEK